MWGSPVVLGAKRRDEPSSKLLLGHAKSYFTLPNPAFPSHWDRSAAGLHQSCVQQRLATLLWAWKVVFTPGRHLNPVSQKTRTCGM